MKIQQNLEVQQKKIKTNKKDEVHIDRLKRYHDKTQIHIEDGQEIQVPRQSDRIRNRPLRLIEEIETLGNPQIYTVYTKL